VSSKGRSAEGYEADPNGFFETQSTVTRAGMTLWGIEPGMTILEPGCGNGAIAKVLRRAYGMEIYIVGIEIDKKRAKQAERAKVMISAEVATSLKNGKAGPCVAFDEVIHGSYFDVTRESLAERGWKKIDKIITNPSFAIWLKVAEHSFTLSDYTSLLIPWNSCASMQRADWWAQHPARARVLSRRPSFAVSVKCVRTSADYAEAKDVTRCKYQVLIGLSVKVPEICPTCGDGIKTTRSDSNEYQWATWSPEYTANTWDPLKTPPPHPDDT